MRRNGNDFCPCSLGHRLDAARRLDAVQHRHPYIHPDQVRLMPQELIHRFLPIRRRINFHAERAELPN